MTNTWQDIGTADVIMVIGGNPAENHPMGFKHVHKAINNVFAPQGPDGTGSKLIVCDPRYTRTASKASKYNGRKMYNKLRPGTDIPFVNGMIWYVMQNNKYNKKYVLSYSNAGFLINENFVKPGDAGNPDPGFYSGYNFTSPPAVNHSGLGWADSTYNKATWQYCKYAAGGTFTPSGTVSVTNGSATVTLSGGTEKWTGFVRAGDEIDIIGDGLLSSTILSVDSDTQLTLTANYTGVTDGSRIYTITVVDREYKGVNIATDFWSAADGGCACGCGRHKDDLSLDPADGAFTAPGTPFYIGNFRQHLLSVGLLNFLDGVVANQKLVWEHMQEHYSRYDKTTVINITGADPTVYDDICDLYSKSGYPHTGDDPGNAMAACILYAMGTTQHTVGTQNIRAYSTLQILLGNMGLSGGGVNAQRGESNVQGSTDHCLLFHILPGYITMPSSTNPGDAFFDQTNPGIGGGDPGHPNQLPSYVKRGTLFKQHANELNWWGFWSGQSNFKRYISSLMKCYWWDALGSPGPTDPATPVQQQQVYDWIPKTPGNCSHMTIFEEMYAGNIKGLFCWGQNPAVGGPNSLKERQAMQNLDWLVVSELWETETAAFWYRPGANPAAIKTEVFVLPAGCHLEKDGSVTNSSRWAQFRYKAVEPPGNGDNTGTDAHGGSDGIPLGAKHETWMLNALYEEIRALIPDSQIQNLTMGMPWYQAKCLQPLDPWGAYADPTADFLDGEINGFNVAAGYPSAPPANTVGSFTALQDNGTTSAGNWLYTNMYVGVNKSKNRNNAPMPADCAPIFKNWAWDWPVNRRIIYNGASQIPCGWGGVSDTSWDTQHKVLDWTGTAWSGSYDVPDAVANPHGYTGHSERTPFIMKPEGHCRLHGMGLADGPYPEHYEPVDTLFFNLPNPMGHPQVINPAITIYEPTKIGSPIGTPAHPTWKARVVATTYRCTEHWQAGAATRHLPWQCEMFPECVVEMSPETASYLQAVYHKPIHGKYMNIYSFRGTMKAKALVTNRFEPLTIMGKTVHQIGIFWHWGYKGISKGHSANRLTAHVGDANTRIPEYKAFLCHIQPV